MTQERMSAFTQNGHSDHRVSGQMNGGFRPLAVTTNQSIFVAD
jgi:hypothetical protein